MDSKLILDAARGTLDGTLSFPEVVGQLLAAGVEYYHVDYVGLLKRPERFLCRWFRFYFLNISIHRHFSRWWCPAASCGNAHRDGARTASLLVAPKQS